MIPIDEEAAERAREKRDRANVAALEKWLLTEPGRRFEVHAISEGVAVVLTSLTTPRRVHRGVSLGDAMAQAATVLTLEDE